MPDDTTPAENEQPVHRQPATVDACQSDFADGAAARDGFDANVKRHEEQS